MSIRRIGAGARMSQAVIHGNTAYLAGCVARDPEGKDVAAQTKDILEQMSQWESFVDVVNQVAEVIRMQQQILQATEKARETRTEGVFDANQ